MNLGFKHGCRRATKKFTINQLYNQKFKKVLCYHWVRSSIIVLCIDNFFLTTKDLCILNICVDAYPDLSYFLESWAKYKRFKFVFLVGPNNTPQHVGGWDQGDLDHDD